MRHLIPALLLLSLFLGCKSNAENAKQSDPLYDEIMGIHDKIMPEMNTIHLYKKELQTLRNEKTQDVILNRIFDLERTDEAMMSWMAEFKLPDDKTKENSYLLDQKIKINQLSDQIIQSMKEAKTLIDSLKQIR